MIEGKSEIGFISTVNGIKLPLFAVRECEPSVPLVATGWTTNQRALISYSLMIMDTSKITFFYVNQMVNVLRFQGFGRQDAGVPRTFRGALILLS